MKKAPSKRATPAKTSRTAKVAETGSQSDEDMRPEYDFRGGVRGKYAARYSAGAIAVVLDPDVAHVFPDAAAVNDALRALAGIIERNRKPPRNSRRRTV